MALEGQQFEQFSQILRSAFSLQRFDEMLRFRLGRNREDIALGGDYQEIVFRVIRAAEMEEWLSELVVGARAARPGNQQLVAFAQLLSLAPVNTPGREALEKLIAESNSMLDIAQWRAQLGLLEGRVCRVELFGQAAGTGFLLSPNLVMTNYHVVKPVIDGQNGATAEQLKVRFDYKQNAAGGTVNQGTVFDLMTHQWLIDTSPYDEVDLQPSPKSAEAALDHLDYALLRLRGEPGNQPIGGKADQEAPARGWLEFTKPSHDFRTQPALFIVQHPQGQPMKLALDTQAVVEVNQNHARVRYRTNTEPGSSGSPVFDQNWHLVALHHSGEPAFRPSWNEGIPFSTIMELLTERGIATQLGAQQHSSGALADL